MHHESHLLASYTDEEDIGLHAKFNSELYWCSPELDPHTYKHPEGKPMFDIYGGKPRESLNQPGVFANIEDVKAIEHFDWPNPDYLDFSHTLKTIDLAASKGMAIFSGSGLRSFMCSVIFLAWIIISSKCTQLLPS